MEIIVLLLIAGVGYALWKLSTVHVRLESTGSTVLISAKKVMRLETALRETEQHLLALTDEVAFLKREVARIAPASPAVIEDALSQTSEVAAPVAETVETASEVKMQRLSDDVIERLQSSSSEAIDKQPPPAKVPFIIERSRQEWEELIGGQWLNRIGAVALIFGIGFFLKYAFDNDLISETMRVLIGAFTGFGLLSGGVYSHRKNLPVFAQGLIGAGISVLYLSVYASFNFYHLVPQSVAFALMSFITVGAFLLALRYDSLAVSLLGFIGGFLTPSLLNDGEANAVGLFSYLLFLNAGIAAVLLRKKEWAVLEPFSFVATAVIYILWFFQRSADVSVLPAAVFLTLFWALFVALDAYRILTQAAADLALRRIIQAGNVVFYLLFIHLLITDKSQVTTTAIALSGGGIYAGVFFLMRHYKPDAAQSHSAHSAVLAALCVAVASEVQFEDFTVVMLWSLEAAALIGLCVRASLSYLAVAGLTLFLGALLRLIASPGALAYTPIEAFQPVLNLRALGFISLALSLAVSARWLRRLPQESQAESRAELMEYLWSGLVFVWLSAEVSDFFRWQSGQYITLFKSEIFRGFIITHAASMSMVWSLYATLLAWLALRSGLRPLYYAALCVLCLAAIWNGWLTQYEPLQSFIPILNSRTLSVLIAIGSISLQLSWLKKSPKSPKSSISPASKSMFSQAMQYALCLLTLFLLTTETLDTFGRPSDLRSAADFQCALTLIAVWTGCATGFAWLGLRTRTLPYLHAGLAFLAIALLTAFLRGLVFIPAEKFFPLINFRFAAAASLIASLLFIADYMKKSDDAFPVSPNFTGGLGIAAIILSVAVLTAETNDFFNREIQLLLAQAANASLYDLNNQRQLAISTVWMLCSISLMLLGIWQRKQPIRLAAMGLFAMTIMKIFIYDLSFLSTLHRIFSFIGLGVILLGVSFLYQKFKHVIFDVVRAEQSPEQAS